MTAFNENDYSLDTRIKFVLRHVRQLSIWQEPDMLEHCDVMVANADLDWLNKSFTKFAKLYEFDRETIERLVKEIEQ